MTSRQTWDVVSTAASADSRQLIVRKQLPCFYAGDLLEVVKIHGFADIC